MLVHRDIDVALLRAFTSVVDTGSVTAAARLLNRTQAAVSLQIKRLEDLLGQSLFEREHRRLTLSPAGERLLANAQKLVALNDAVFGQMTTREFEGEVRFGVPTDIVRTYIPPILRRFNTAWPRVRVTLQLGNSSRLLEAYGRGEIDLSLTTDHISDQRAETLRVDHLVWVGAPLGVAHLANPLPLAIGDPTCRFRPVVLEALRKVGRDWRLVLELSHQVAQDATVSAGIALSAELRDSVSPALVVLGPEAGLPPLTQFMINMHAPKPGTNFIADALASHVRAEFKQRFGDDAGVKNMLASTTLGDCRQKLNATFDVACNRICHKGEARWLALFLSKDGRKLMITATTFIVFFGTCVLLALTPGPNMSLIVANTLAGGLQAGLTTLAGSSTGLAILVTIAAAGMSSLMVLMSDWFDTIRWAGALYLIVLGIRQLRTWQMQRRGASPALPPSATTTYAHGVLVSLSNPKVLLFLGAFLPQFVDATRDPVPQLTILAVIFWATLLVTDLAYTVALARARRSIDMRKLQMLDGLAGGLLLIGGLVLATARRPG